MEMVETQADEQQNQDQIMNIIAENNSLKERLTSLELLCKLLQQKIDKLEETIIEIEQDIYEDDDDDDDDKDDDDKDDDDDDEDDDDDDDKVVRFLPQS